MLCRVENIAAISKAGGVDQHIDAFEAAIGFGDHLSAFGDAFKIGAHEDCRAACRLDFGGDARAIGFVAPADNETGGAALGEQPGDRLAEALRTAGDHRDLAGQIGWAAISGRPRIARHDVSSFR